MATARRLVVFGGSGFVGSAICSSAVARGWSVISLTRRGEPYATQSGFVPAWVDKVDWRKGTPFDSTAYADLLPTSDAVVSTLGTLLENSYKEKGAVSPLGVAQGVLGNLLGDKGNPLRKGAKERSYEHLNRDAALAAFRAFAASAPSSPGALPSPFLFISAEDIFRPFIDSRYISTKREAENIIFSESLSPELARKIRPIFVRPSLIYHPHKNPFSTLPATVLSASSRVQSLLPSTLRVSSFFPQTPGLPPITSSMASLLTIPPIHVDTIGEAVCMAIEDESVRGVMGVKEMRGLVGYDDPYDLEGRETKGFAAGSSV
ncbi:mitochondrion NAD(P)-binding protein [Pseudohyphozyma bogoriensis]|nr:mitochondrion NAD(P)-binding protein [Pseudohyphozyma bogoriensis]